jgi:hypothetical protein
MGTDENVPFVWKSGRGTGAILCDCVHLGKAGFEFRRGGEVSRSPQAGGERWLRIGSVDWRVVAGEVSGCGGVRRIEGGVGEGTG